MKFYYPLLALIFYQATLYAQLNPNQQLFSDPNNIDKLSKGAVYYSTNYHDVKIEGTPFLFESVDADIVTTKNEIYEGQKVSYDASQDEFVFQKANRMLVLEKKSVNYVLASHRKFILFDNEYYEMLSDGKFMFLKKHTKIIKRGVYNAALSTGSKNDRWEVETSYYIVENKKISNSIKLKKKSLIDFLQLSSSQQEDIEKRKLDYSSEVGVRKIVDLANQEF